MSIVEEILRERIRQVEKEGWSCEYDDTHDEGQLARAAACYAVYPKLLYDQNRVEVWPWDNFDQVWNKRSQYRRRLVIAAALLVAEIERLDRNPKDEPPRGSGCGMPHHHHTCDCDGAGGNR